MVSATRQLLDRVPTARSAVSAISFSGQMMGVVALDHQLRPVRPAIIWANSRSAKQSAALRERIGEDRGYQITGHRIHPNYSLSKIMWLAEMEPKSLRRTRFVCNAKDYIAARMTGSVVTDPSDASGTNAFDQESGTWSDEILAAASVLRTILPEIVPSTTVIGAVRKDAASELGLDNAPSVVVGAGDGATAAVGAGVVSAGDGAFACLGTSSWISVAAERPLLDPQKRTMTFNHAVPGAFLPMATMQTAGGALDWVVSAVAPGNDGEMIATLVDEAATVTAARDGLFFMPYLLGERSPLWDPDIRASFIGLSRHHTRAQLVRAVLEGVAFNLFTCVAAFREAGVGMRQVDVVGGGARSDLWLQIFADVWGAHLRRRSIVEEGNSLGAAVIAGVGIGTIPAFSVAKGLSTVTAEFEPDLTAHAEYAVAHTRFKDLYDRLRSWFAPGVVGT